MYSYIIFFENDETNQIQVIGIIINRLGIDEQPITYQVYKVFTIFTSLGSVA